MSNHDPKECLAIVNSDIIRYMAEQFYHGNTQHEGSGDNFLIQAASAAFSFLVGCRHMVNKGPIEFDRLNELCGKSTWGFNELDVPEDEVLLHGIFLSKIFITGMQQRREHGDSAEGQKLRDLNGLIRESAIEAVKMVGEDKATPSILNIARMTADELKTWEADMAQRRSAMNMPVQGHA